MASPTSLPYHTTAPSTSTSNSTVATSSSLSSVHEDGTNNKSLQRPKLGRRKSSGTMIVPREHPRVELKEGDEVFDTDDARAMSPRRNSEDLEKMIQDAREQLSQKAKVLHDSLLEIFNHIDVVKEEHDKLDSNNKLLQKCIGDLVSMSKITSTGASGRQK